MTSKKFQENSSYPRWRMKKHECPSLNNSSENMIFTATYKLLNNVVP